MCLCRGGCGSRVISGYCDRCRARGGGRDQRRSAHARGYDRRWQAFRIVYLREHPLCADCEKRGRVTLAEHIHHIKKLVDAPHLKYEEGNLMPLCEPCHAVRTARGE